MKKDLIVLVADKNMQFTLFPLLNRFQALNIRPIRFDIFIHPQRDPGIYKGSHLFLREFSALYQYAMVFLDYEGSGAERKKPEEIRNEILENLKRNGWPNKAEIIVFDPELEIWAWIDSPHLSKVLGWSSFGELKSFLLQTKYWSRDENKPNRPKECFDLALRHNRIPRSSAIYQQIATHVSFRNCQDLAFKRFLETLQLWFPPNKNIVY